MLYMVKWIPSIYPSHVSIYTSTMDPMGMLMIFLDASEVILHRGPVVFRYVFYYNHPLVN